MITEKKCVPCQVGIPPLNENEINNFIKEIDVDWEVHENRQLQKEYVFKTYKQTMIFANSIAALAEDEGHHPFIHINYKTARLILFTHKINGLHENDFILAYKCDKLYESL
tara:strand:- start:691 stop:1023 length:333 start_codon:yes stop_codon:yes gene_type:complete